MLSDNILIFTAMICLLAQTCAWLWQKRTQNTDIVDITWSGLIIVISLIYFFDATDGFFTNNNFHSYIILIFPAAWYLRLSWHLIARYRVTHEDGRYQELRAHWSENTQIKLFLFFLFQAGLAWLFSYPAYVIANINMPFNWLDGVAIVIAVISLIGVTLSDHQLQQFRNDKNNKGKVCDRGFWRYSRHPNYFFEWSHWLAYPLLAIGAEGFWLVVFYPLIMLVFLLKLTGIPFNEEQNIRSKGDKYRFYQKTTNKFFPGPIKKVKLRSSYDSSSN